MPTGALHPCKQPRCPYLTSGRFCVAHTQVDEERRRNEARLYDDRRGSSSARGYGSRWQAYRRAFLLEHPLCECELHQGRDDAPCATDVDHIRPVTGPDDAGFWDRSNHQALAHACHSRKTAREDGRWGRRPRGAALGAD